MFDVGLSSGSEGLLSTMAVGAGFCGEHHNVVVRDKSFDLVLF